MFAYVVSAVYPAYGNDKFKVILYSDGDKKCAAEMAQQLGWHVKRISIASFDEIADLKDYRVVLQSLKDVCRRRIEDEARRRRQADLEQFQKEEAARQERERRRREQEERRELAIVRVIGDIVGSEPEQSIAGNSQVATICSKISLFFNQSSVNKADIYTSISLDFAQLQVTARDFPNTIAILQNVVNDLNAYLAIEASIVEAHHQLELATRSAEGTANSIASRTHVFGGSGDGLLLSWLVAEGAASADRKQIEAISRNLSQQRSAFESGRSQAKRKQRLLEYRAKTAVDVVLSATRLGEAVSLDIPEDIEEMARLM